MSRPKTEPVSVVYLEIEYDDIPESDELNELMTSARNYGFPRKAELHIKEPKVIDLTKRY